MCLGSHSEERCSLGNMTRSQEQERLPGGSVKDTRAEKGPSCSGQVSGNEGSGRAAER